MGDDLVVPLGNFVRINAIDEVEKLGVDHDEFDDAPLVIRAPKASRRDSIERPEKTEANQCQIEVAALKISSKFEAIIFQLQKSLKGDSVPLSRMALHSFTPAIADIRKDGGQLEFDAMARINENGAMMAFDRVMEPLGLLPTMRVASLPEYFRTFWPVAFCRFCAWTRSQRRLQALSRPSSSPYLALSNARQFLTAYAPRQINRRAASQTASKLSAARAWAAARRVGAMARDIKNATKARKSKVA